MSVAFILVGIALGYLIFCARSIPAPRPPLKMPPPGAQLGQSPPTGDLGAGEGIRIAPFFFLGD